MDWIHVDWRKTNRELADTLGFAMVTVNNARKKYYPDDPYSHDSERFWDSIDWSKSDKQIMGETGASYESVHHNRYKYDEKESGYRSRRKKAAKVYQAYLEKHHVTDNVKQPVKPVSWLYR